MGSSKNIVSGVVWSIFANIVNALYGFIMIPVLINYFGKAEYGIIGLAQSINAYMQIMDMGLNSSNVRFFSNWLVRGDNERVKRLFSTCTAFYGIIGLANAAVLIIVYMYTNNLFNLTSDQDAILKDLLLILAISAFVNWFTSCYNQIISATENVAWTQKRLLVTKILLVLVLCITVWLKLDIVSYYILTVFCTWVILPAVVLKIKQVAPMVSFIPKFSKEVFVEILPYTLNIFSFTIFSFSFNNLKPVFLGMQSTPESVADYKILMGISGLINSVSGVFLSSLLPSSSKVIAEDNKEKYNMIAYQGTKYIMIFVSFCVFGMLCIDQDLLILYVGDSYNDLVPWLDVFILLLLSNHILGISSLILGGSNIVPLSRMTAISSLIGLIAIWLLIPYYEVGGVAIGSVIYSIAQMGFYYFYFWPKVMKINSKTIFLSIVLPILLYSVLLYFITTLIIPQTSHWSTIINRGSLFFCLYMIVTYFYLNKGERLYIRRIFFSKTKSR